MELISPLREINQHVLLPLLVAAVCLLSFSFFFYTQLLRNEEDIEMWAEERKKRKPQQKRH